ncbi:hypothetical protein KAURM247S_00903 [Kitasatospora aureofaciens]
MVLRALASPLPIAWVNADSAYGQEGRFRRLLEQSGVGYVLAVPKSQFSVGCPRIDWLFSQAPAEAWERISCGHGAKGPRVYDWAAIRLPAVAEYDYQGETQVRQRWALARRSLGRPDEIAYYLAYSQLDTTVEQLVRIAGIRWTIEECFQAAKNECGLDQYEVRRYTGWMRHITLAMLAHAFLAAMAAVSKGAAETVPPSWWTSPWQRSGGSWRLAAPTAYTRHGPRPAFTPRTGPIGADGCGWDRFPDGWCGGVFRPPPRLYDALVRYAADLDAGVADAHGQGGGRARADDEIPVQACGRSGSGRCATGSSAFSTGPTSSTASQSAPG